MTVFGAFRRAAVIVLASACANTVGPVGCDPCRTTAIVNVHVRDSTDQPVPGVPFQIRSYLQVCGLDLRGGDDGRVTLADGHRRILMSSLYSPHTARCFVVTINPDSAPGLPRGRQEFADSVEFRAEDGTPRDSVRFDMIVSGN